MSLTWFLFLLCLVMGLAAWTVFWWSVRAGQFHDTEAAAAEMLELDLLDGTEPVEPSAREIQERSAAKQGRAGREGRG